MTRTVWTSDVRVYGNGYTSYCYRDGFYTEIIAHEKTSFLCHSVEEVVAEITPATQLNGYGQKYFVKHLHNYFHRASALCHSLSKCFLKSSISFLSTILLRLDTFPRNKSFNECPN